MSFMNRVISVLVLVVAVCGTTQGADGTGEPTMKVKDVIAETLNTNPNILADKADRRSREHVERREWGGYLPALDIRAGAGYEHTREKTRENLPCDSGKKCLENRFIRADPSATLRQMVFDGFQTKYSVDKARNEKIQSEKKVDETAELTVFRAVDSYITVRRFQRLLKLTKANVAAHKRILGKVNALIKGGRATIADRHTVEARLHDAEAAVRDVQGDLSSSVARFTAVTGIEPGNLSSSRLPDDYLPVSLDEAIKMALEYNRSMVLAQSGVEVARSDLDLTYSPFFPRLDIELEGRHNKNTFARSGFENNFLAQAVLRYNLYNGGKDVAQQKATAESLARSRHQHEQSRRVAQRETHVSWGERQSALGQADRLRKSVQSKIEVKRAFKQQYDLGLRSLLDLLDSENEYFLAKGSLITVDATSDITGIRLLASMGIMLDKFGFRDSAPMPAVQPAVATDAGAPAASQEYTAAESGAVAAASTDSITTEQLAESSANSQELVFDPNATDGSAEPTDSITTEYLAGAEDATSQTTQPRHVARDTRPSSRYTVGLGVEIPREIRSGSTIGQNSIWG